MCFAQRPSAMPSSHSRRQTRGAFGNSKPRPIERDFSAPEPAPVEKAPRVLSIADKFSTFCQPILEQAGNNRTAAKGAMNVAILIWNASIEGAAKIKEAKTKLCALPGSSPAQVEELVTSMIARKDELYPNENSLITNFKLKFSHRRTSFSISAVNIKPEGLTKADLQDIITPSM
jgi:hypothetical protein